MQPLALAGSGGTARYLLGELGVELLLAHVQIELAHRRIANVAKEDRVDLVTDSRIADSTERVTGAVHGPETMKDGWRGKPGRLVDLNAERKRREGFLVGTGMSEMVRGVGDTAARLDLKCPA